MVELDVFEHVLLRLLPRLAALALHGSRLSVLKKNPASALSQVNRGRRGVRRDAAGCARVGADDCHGIARGRAPAGSGRFRGKRAPISPWVLGFCAVFGGGSFAAGFSDLVKRRHCTAFLADPACETAQKLQTGLAGCKERGGRAGVFSFSYG